MPKPAVEPQTSVTRRVLPDLAPMGKPAKEAARAKPRTNSAPEPEAMAEPAQPKTDILDTSATSGALATDGHDPILDPPPLPNGMTTLVGGVISRVDRIRNRLTVHIYGGGRWTVFFDERTHIFNRGAEVTQLALKPGERVYVDTMLDNNKRDVFARNIRVGIVTVPADTEGQIVDVSTRHSEVILRDSINSEDVRFSVADDTKISKGSKPASFADLVPGSLVRVKFAPERPNRGLAREIAILATPGTAFTFIGQVTFMDRHRGVLAVHNTIDNKTYDLYITPGRMDTTSNLAVGADVRVVAIFEGNHYSAQQITVTKRADAASK